MDVSDGFHFITMGVYFEHQANAPPKPAMQICPNLPILADNIKVRCKDVRKEANLPLA
jgi:hypothetical protein